MNKRIFHGLTAEQIEAVEDYVIFDTIDITPGTFQYTVFKVSEEKHICDRNSTNYYYIGSGSRFICQRISAAFLDGAIDILNNSLFSLRFPKMTTERVFHLNSLFNVNVDNIIIGAELKPSVIIPAYGLFYGNLIINEDRVKIDQPIRLRFWMNGILESYL